LAEPTTTDPLAAPDVSGLEPLELDVLDALGVVDGLELLLLHAATETTAMAATAARPVLVRI